jgi:uncharacterized membrane protein YdjX (TVP38/TMEM64 family)
MKPDEQPSLAFRRSLLLLVVMTITLAISLNRSRFAVLEELGYVGAFLVMLLSNATLILPAPGLIFVFALGSTLNPLWVGLFAGIGAALGELTGYMTGYSGLALLENTPLAHRVEHWMNTNGILTIFILSAIPNPLFDLAGIMAGTGRMPIWKFLSAACCGKCIQAIFIAIAGDMSLSWVEKLLVH